jgi:hypothetical protein
MRLKGWACADLDSASEFGAPARARSVATRCTYPALAETTAVVMLPPPFTRRQLRRTVCVTLFAWLFALLSGAVNACLIQPSATDLARSKVSLVDPLVGEVAGPGQSTRQTQPTQHHADDEHGGLVDDLGEAGCLKFCADESSALSKSESYGADMVAALVDLHVAGRLAVPVVKTDSSLLHEPPRAQGHRWSSASCA